MTVVKSCYVSCALAVVQLPADRQFDGGNKVSPKVAAMLFLILCSVRCTLCCIRCAVPHAVCALQVLADRQYADSSKVCPEAKASVFSLITFGWISGLMRQGYKYAQY